MQTVSSPRPRARAWAAALVLAVPAGALVAAGCGGGGSAGSSPGTPAQYVPATAPMYLEASTQTGPDTQWAQITELAERFPAYPELKASITAELAESGVDFDGEIRPLLGGTAALAVLDVPEVSGGGPAPGAAAAAGRKAAQDAQVLAVVEIADGKQQQVVDLLTKDPASGARVTGTRDGASLLTDGDDMYAAVTADALVLASSAKDVALALDTREAGADRSLAGTAKFTQALDALPEGQFAQGYLDLTSFGQAIVKATPQLGQLGTQGLTSGQVAVALTAEPTGVRLKAVVVDGPDAATQSTFMPTLTAQVPQDAIAYLGFSDLAGTVERSVSQLSALSPQGQEQVQAFASQIPKSLGVTVEDLAALASGEHAIVVTKGRPVPTVALVLKVDDGARALATLNRLANNAPKLVEQFSPSTAIPAWRDADLGPGAVGRRLPLSPEAGVVYGVKGNLVVIGTLPDGVRSILQPTATLSEDKGFQAATEPVQGQAVSGLFWLNAEEGLPLLDAAGAFEGKDGQKALDNLRPVKNAVAWSTGGDQPTVEAFVTIEGAPATP